MELEPARLSTEIIPPDLYLTEESIALAAVVDAIDERIFKKWQNGEAVQANKEER